MSHHYQVHSDLQDPPRTKALILYWRTNGVESGRRWRQFHWIVHHILEWCNQNFDPSVGVWCWMRWSKRRVWEERNRVDYIPICSNHYLLRQDYRSPVQIGEPVWQLGENHQLQLETDQTGCLWRQNTLELNSTFAKEFLLEHEKRWRKITPRKLDKAKVFDVVTVY